MSPVGIKPLTGPELAALEQAFGNYIDGTGLLALRAAREVQVQRESLEGLSIRVRELEMLRSAYRERAELAEKERDAWKRRAAQHGCDVEEGDIDCG